ncbi:hypothetical protein BGZ70_004334, partial [Mortierella alpina]
ASLSISKEIDEVLSKALDTLSLEEVTLIVNKALSVQKTVRPSLLEKPNDTKEEGEGHQLEPNAKYWKFCAVLEYPGYYQLRYSKNRKRLEGKLRTLCGSANIPTDLSKYIFTKIRDFDAQITYMQMDKEDKAPFELGQYNKITLPGGYEKDQMMIYLARVFETLPACHQDE